MQSERALSLSIEMFKGNKSYALSSDLFILPMICIVLSTFLRKELN